MTTEALARELLAEELGFADPAAALDWVAAAEGGAFNLQGSKVHISAALRAIARALTFRDTCQRQLDAVDAVLPEWKDTGRGRIETLKAALQSGGWEQALERWSHVDQDETSFEAIYERHLAGELSFYGAVRESIASLLALSPPPETMKGGE